MAEVIAKMPNRTIRGKAFRLEKCAWNIPEQLQRKTWVFWITIRQVASADSGTRDSIILIWGFLAKVSTTQLDVGQF